LPQNTRAEIPRGSWPIAPLFELIQTRGHVEEREMFTTFNMGIGMVAVVAPDEAESAIFHLKSQNIETFQIGEIVESEGAADVVLI